MRRDRVPAERIASCGVVGSFSDEERWRRAAARARAHGMDFEAYSPIADERVVREMRPQSPRSPVRLWTLGGGIFGGVAAFAMTIWMSRNWPLVEGGKPIVSWPPFICIGFEMTVLYASFACLASFLALGRLPRLTLPAAYRSEFAVDRYGLYLPGEPETMDDLRGRLHAAGAERIWIVHNPFRGRLADPDCAGLADEVQS
ncbi:MAG TPA: DUF3341 domain-containing protein [Terriglobales bacterium]|nr:DUF3341 domain-containing protein [Terriglobales bacterium]